MAQQRDGARSSQHASADDDVRIDNLLSPFAKALSPRQRARVVAALARCPFAELHQELARAERTHSRDPASAAAALVFALVTLSRVVTAAARATGRLS